MDQHTCREISYREAQIIRAMNPRSASYDPASGLVTVNYISHQERQSLVYRDEVGWRELLQMIIKYNLLGIVAQNFKALGNEGAKVIADSFLVMPEAKLY